MSARGAEVGPSTPLASRGGRTETPLEEERTTSDAADAGRSRPSRVPDGATDVEAVDRVTVIRPASRIPHLDIGELWHYRELLWTLVWRDVSVRYKQTFLGVAWAILVPAFTALVYVIVFGKFANFPAGTTPYPSLVVAGVLPMQYFASALSLASLSLLSNLPLVTKVYFPRTLLPLGGVCVPLVDFVVGLPVLVVLIWKYDTWPSGWETLTAPLWILLAVVTVLGISLLLAAVNVRYRDVRYMIPVFLQVLPLLSGVMFAVDQIPVKWQWILAFNPMTSVIAGWRWAVLDASQPEHGPGRHRRRRRVRAVRRRARHVPHVGAELRGHDLMAIAIEVDSLSKKYRLGEYQAAYGTLRETLVHAGRRLTRQEHHRPAAEIWALRDVSFQVPEGQVLGIIGRNGAGKSTLLKILTRIAFPTEGRAEIRGRVGSLLEVGTGFNQELTGRENVYLNGAILGMKRREIEQRFDDIVEFSGVERFIDTPVKRYSSGMYVRLAFAVAAHLEPEILFVDEVLSVGDAEFQRRCLGRMEELANTGRTVVFVSHALPAVAQLCDRAIWIDGGQLVGDGPAAEVIANYLHQTHAAGSERTWTAGVRARERPREDPRDPGARPRGDAAGYRGRAPAGRHRDRVRRATRGKAALPEDQGARRGGRDRLQRDGHGRALASAVRARRSTSRPRGSRGTC